MNSIVAAIQRGLGVLIDGAMRVLSTLGPAWALLILSLVSGVVLALVYGRISFQSRLRQVKQAIHAGMLEAVLYRHDTRLALKAQGRMLAGGMQYFMLAVPPILILALPCLLLMGQLNSWFGYRSPAPGQSMLLHARLDSPTLAQPLQVQADNIEIVGPLRNPAQKELLWRLAPKGEGQHQVSVVSANAAALTFEIPARGTLSRVDPIQSSSILDTLLFPPRKQGVLPQGVASIEISYPGQEIEIFGFKTHWIVFFLIVSLLGGFVAARTAGVEL